MYTLENFKKVKHDVNGNPRFVISHLALLTDEEKATLGRQCYPAAVSKSRVLGGKKYRGKDYAGAIVFQAYACELPSLLAKINKLNGSVK